MTQKPHTKENIERMTVSGSQLLEYAQKILYQGNIRRIVISQEGRVLAEFPLTVGVVGAVLAPVLAAIGALAALLSKCTIEIERVAEESAAIEQEKAQPHQGDASMPDDPPVDLSANLVKGPRSPEVR